MTEKVAIFDTNSLPLAGSLNTNFWRAIFQLCKVFEVEPVLPEIVIHESVNLRMTRAGQAAENLYTAANQLGKFVDIPSIYLPSVEEVGRNWEKELRAKFQVISVEGSDALEALRREAVRHPPARDGVGARDSAIWLTVTRLAMSGKAVSFVSKNIKDFASESSNELHQTLLDDLASASGTVSYFVSVRSFIDSLAVATTTPITAWDDAVLVLADPIKNAAVELLEEGAFESSAEKIATASVNLINMESLAAYEVSGGVLGLVSGVGTLQPDEEKDALVSLEFHAWIDFDIERGQPASAELVKFSIRG